MDHVGNAAHQVHRVKHEDGLRAVGHGDGHLVALAHADGLEGLGALFHLLYQPAVSGGAAHEVKRHIIGVLVGNFLHGVEHGAFKIIQMHGQTAQMAGPGGLCGNFTHQYSTFIIQRQFRQSGFSRQPAEKTHGFGIVIAIGRMFIDRPMQTCQNSIHPFFRLCIFF